MERRQRANHSGKRQTETSGVIKVKPIAVGKQEGQLILMSPAALRPFTGYPLVSKWRPDTFIRQARPAVILILATHQCPSSPQHLPWPKLPLTALASGILIPSEACSFASLGISSFLCLECPHLFPPQLLDAPSPQKISQTAVLTFLLCSSGASCTHLPFLHHSFLSTTPWALLGTRTDFHLCSLRK